jgi:hypothetical protein
MSRDAKRCRTGHIMEKAGTASIWRLDAKIFGVRTKIVIEY